MVEAVIRGGRVTRTILQIIRYTNFKQFVPKNVDAFLRTCRVVRWWWWRQWWFSGPCGLDQGHDMTLPGTAAAAAAAAAAARRKCSFYRKMKVCARLSTYSYCAKKKTLWWEWPLRTLWGTPVGLCYDRSRTNCFLRKPPCLRNSTPHPKLTFEKMCQLHRTNTPTACE